MPWIYDIAVETLPQITREQIQAYPFVKGLLLRSAPVANAHFVLNYALRIN